MLSEEALIEEILLHFPNPGIELQYNSSWQIYVAVVLSAQCTDKVVNEVTAKLFQKYPDSKSMLGIDQGELESLIYSTGFYKNKAKTLINAAVVLQEKYGGDLPSSMDELLRVPGIGRKSANVILSAHFKKHEGIVVDTHVSRIAQRLGLTDRKDPARIEKDLMAFFNVKNWGTINTGLVLFGRYICKAKKPDCHKCNLKKYCTFYNGPST